MKKLVGATSRVSRAGLGSHLGCCDPLGLVAKRLLLGSCCIRAGAGVARCCHLAVALTGGHTLQEQVKVKTIYKQLQHQNLCEVTKSLTVLYCCCGSGQVVVYWTIGVLVVYCTVEAGLYCTLDDVVEYCTGLVPELYCTWAPVLVPVYWTG